MYLSYFTDETHPDFATALRLGQEWGLRHAEIRVINGVNLMDLSDAQIAEAKALLDRYDMRVTAVATPFLKCDLPHLEQGSQGDKGPLHGAKALRYADHLALLPRGVALAQAFGAPNLRIFSFWRAPRDAHFWQTMDEAVEKILAAVAGTGIQVCLENEGACCIATTAELVELAARYANTDLKIIYDPGNSTRAGMSPRLYDFAAFHDRIALVHLKDGVYFEATDSSEARCIGAGETDYAAELRHLHGAGYAGALTLEPHYCPNDDCTEGMRQSVVAIREIAQQAEIEL
ncbi:MAG: sugar phosphate isomerase/epimerase family protein, partial [Litorilinea sp.]